MQPITRAPFALLCFCSTLLATQAFAQVETGSFIKASNPDSGDSFGMALSLDGDTLVVGAGLEDGGSTGTLSGGMADPNDDSSSSAGSAYVFVRSGDTWVQQDYLKASNTDAGDRFGLAVAVSGDTIAVGAFLEDSASTAVGGDEASNSSSSSGAVYVFERTGSDWNQTAYLKAFNTDSDDHFGRCVAVEGDVIVVGAPGEASNVPTIVYTDTPGGPEDNNDAPDAGALYVFRRLGGVWSQEAYLKASNPGGTDELGRRIAISGDTIVAGARFEDSASNMIDGDGTDNSASQAGAAYVFRKTGAVWAEEAYLKASNAEGNDWFGHSVAIDDDTILVGAVGEDGGGTGTLGDPADNTIFSSGAVYVFRRTGVTWSEEAYLKASNTDWGDSFGQSVTIEGNVVGVGAYNEDSSDVGVNGDEANDDTPSDGAAYVFVRSASTWAQKAYLKSPSPGVGDQFGAAISLDGTDLIVGEQLEDSNAAGIDGSVADNSANNAGAVNAFELSLGATSSFRNGGTNPISYTATAPTLGATWTGSVDLTTTGHSIATIVGYLFPASVLLPSLQTVLVNPGSPGGELLGLAPLPGPTATFTAVIPMDASLCGLALSTQSVHVGGGMPYALGNAQDLVIGF